MEGIGEAARAASAPQATPRSSSPSLPTRGGTPRHAPPLPTPCTHLVGIGDGLVEEVQEESVPAGLQRRRDGLQAVHLQQHGGGMATGGFVWES